jgi:hypothetical protein
MVFVFNAVVFTVLVFIPKLFATRNAVINRVKTDGNTNNDGSNSERI